MWLPELLGPVDLQDPAHRAVLIEIGATVPTRGLFVTEAQLDRLGSVIEVDDLDGYWSEIAPKDLPARFPGVRLRPPTDFPWGREVHIIDPGGVCWHVRQASRAT